MSVFKKTLAVLAVASAVTASVVMPAQARQDGGDGFQLTPTNIAIIIGSVAVIAFLFSDDSDSG